MNSDSPSTPPAQTTPIDGGSEPEPLRPEAKPTQSWLQILRSRLGLPTPPTLRDTLEETLQSSDAATAFSAEERGMLLRLLRIHSLRVVDVMVPRADIIALDETVSFARMLETFDDAGVSRIPVYRETLDDPRGMIHIKDVVSWMIAEAARSTEPAAKSFPVAPVQVSATPASRLATVSSSRQTAADTAAAAPIPASERKVPANLAGIDLQRSVPVSTFRRPVLYVPPSMPAMSLLHRMQTARIHMAIVVDEYGGTDGLVTIEDLVEQIVGKIEDEHDEREDEHLVEDPKEGLLAFARVPVAELEQRLGLQLLTEENRDSIDTLGGLVFSLVGRVPGRGELIRHPAGLEFEILDADARSLKKVRVHQIARSADLTPPRIVATAAATTGPNAAAALETGPRTDPDRA